MKIINFEKANKIYKLFSEKREKKQVKMSKKLQNYPFLILSNLYDRDIFSSEYCINESLSYIGYKNYEIHNSLLVTLTRNNKISISLGRIFSNSKNKFKEILKLISPYVFINIFAYCLKVLISLADAILIIIYYFIFLLIQKIFKTEIFSKVS